jgi:hypothetical protein
VTPLLLCLALAAPAPLARRAPPMPCPVAGSHAVTFAGVPCSMTFGPGGEYSCRWYGAEYAGSWSYDRRGRVLRITEAAASNPRHWMFWEIRLGADRRAGRIAGGGGEFRFLP